MSVSTGYFFCQTCSQGDKGRTSSILKRVNRIPPTVPVMAEPIPRIPGARRPSALMNTPRIDSAVRLFLVTGGNANADNISDAFASREVRAGRFQFRAMNFRIEV